MLNFECSTTASLDRETTWTRFDTILKQAYGQPKMGNVFDMATGHFLPHDTVTVTHIFQYRW